MIQGIMMLFCLLGVLGFPVTGLCVDFFVNGSSGTDSDTCGQLSTTPCKTIKKALDNIPDGEVTIKISRGTYVEDHLGVWGVDSPLVRNVVFEGGWNADFTSHSCNTTGTTIIPGYTSNQGWSVLLHLSVSGNNNQAAMSVSCMTLQKTASGDITSALYIGAEQQGLANLTMDHVRVTGFTDPNTTRFYSRPGGNISVTINNSVFNRNLGEKVLSGEADNGNLSLKMKTNRMTKNGELQSIHHTLFFKSSSGGSIDVFLENNIIAGNSSKDQGAGIFLSSADNSSSTALQSINDTITDNTCNQQGSPAQRTGGAVRVIAFENGASQVIMTNTILKGNHADISAPDLTMSQGIFNDNSGTVSFSADHCILGEYDILEGTPTYSSTNEVDADPRLNSTYHLTGGSPAKDAGLCGYLTGSGPYQYNRVAPYEDIDGDKRPGWGKLMGCDIGADEYRFPWVMFGPATRGKRNP